MNIYTQFGDLNANQMLTLFSLFRNWSEYKDSSFLASFENSMLKMENESSMEEIAAEDDDLPAQEITEEEESSKSIAHSAVSSSPTKLARKK